MKFKLLFIFVLSALSIVHGMEDDATIASNSKKNVIHAGAGTGERSIKPHGSDDDATIATIPHQNVESVIELEGRYRRENEYTITNEMFTLDLTIGKKLSRQAMKHYNFISTFHYIMANNFEQHSDWVDDLSEITAAPREMVALIFWKVCAFNDKYIDDIKTVFENHTWTRGSVDMIESLRDFTKKHDFSIDNLFMRTDFDWESILKEPNGAPNRKLQEMDEKSIENISIECKDMREIMENHKTKLSRLMENLKKKLDPYFKLSQQIRSTIQQILKDMGKTSTTMNTISTQLRQLQLLIENRKLIHRTVGKNNELIPDESCDISPTMAEIEKLLVSIESEYQYFPEKVKMHLFNGQNVFWQEGLFIFDLDKVGKITNDLQEMVGLVLEIYSRLNKKSSILSRNAHVAFIMEIYLLLVKDTMIMESLSQFKLGEVSKKAATHIMSSVNSNRIIKDLPIVRDFSKALTDFFGLYEPFMKSLDEDYMNHKDKKYVEILEEKEKEKIFTKMSSQTQSDLRDLCSKPTVVVSLRKSEIIAKQNPIKTIFLLNIETKPILNSLVALYFQLQMLESGQETRRHKVIDTMKLICKQISDLAKKFNETVPGESFTWKERAMREVDELKKLVDELHKVQKDLPAHLPGKIKKRSYMPKCDRDI